MLPETNKIKGIHPGLIIRRELQKRNIKGNELARMVDEHPQTISAILNAKRSVTAKFSVKLGQILNVDTDYFLILQASYDVKQAEQTVIKKSTPPIESIRKVIFWDTDINKIDWIKSRNAVIKRIFERGNKHEISVIVAFYGKTVIKEELEKISFSNLPTFKRNADKFLAK